jgi:hypothetical protein
MVKKKDMLGMSGSCFVLSFAGMIVYFPVQFIVYYPIMSMEWEKADDCHAVKLHPFDMRLDHNDTTGEITWHNYTYIELSLTIDDKKY